MDNYTDLLFNKTSETNRTIVEVYDEVVDAEEGFEAIMIPVVFSAIFVLGCLGNGTILFLVAKYEQLKTSTNTLVINLAVGDLLVIIVCVPFTGTIYTLPSWLFGEPICKLNEFLQTLSVSVSVFTLTALSVERYRVIVHPSSNSRTTSSAYSWTVILIWLVGVIIAIPDAISAHVSDFKSRSWKMVHICVHYPSNWSQLYPQIHCLGRFLILFAIPLFVIVFCYVGLTIRLLQPMTDYDVAPPQNGGKINKSSASGAIEEDKNMIGHIPVKGTVLQRRERFAKVVLFLIALFAFCWFPRHVFLLWYHFDSSPLNHFWHIFKMVGFCLTFINSCINPCVLYSLDMTFKYYFKKRMLCCCYAMPTEEMVPLGEQVEMSVV